MALRNHYNVDAPWSDPFEVRIENRAADRFAFSMKVSISVEDPLRKGQLVGPGIVHNISMSGVSLITKHKLVAGQKVTLAVPTDMCPDELCLAKAFIGPATVRRAEPREGTRLYAALEFGESLFQNIEFVMFIDYLQNVARDAQAQNQ